MTINHSGKTINVRVSFALGEVQVVAVEPNRLYVANLVGQEGIRPDSGGRPPVRYDAIRRGLEQVGYCPMQLGASVHMPRIGAGLAGGCWSEIARIIDDELISPGIHVTV